MTSNDGLDAQGAREGSPLPGQAWAVRGRLTSRAVASSTSRAHATRPTSSQAPNLEEAIAAPSQDRAFTRSITIDAQPSSSVPARQRMPSTSRRARAPVTYHPTSHENEDSSSAAADIERVLSPGGAHTSSHSAFHLEGRSYRFQQTHNDSAAMPRSYTATSDTIRDSTARLADMALLSDEEASASNGSHFDLHGALPPQSDAATPQARSTHPAPIPNAATLVGPSNLAKALSASDSHGTSPAATVRPAQSQATSPVQPASASATPPWNRTVQRSAVAGSDDSGPERDIHETTPLLANSMTGARRSAASDSETGHRADGSETSRSASASFLDSERGQVQGSAIGLRRERSSFGYGALAQASHLHGHGDSSSWSRRLIAIPSEVQDTPLAQDLAPLWALVPSRLRPGAGRRNLRKSSLRAGARASLASLRKLTLRDALALGMKPVQLLPAVLLGMLLNVLDGVSYGLIIFPASYPIFSSLGGDGVSMFFVTCVLSQLVYTLGGSIFKGGNGSMMIEVVPFYHILVKIIIDEIGPDLPNAVIATTMVAFALSSIFAGVVFLLLGYFRLGVLIGFFPRHILVGCIGGVGIFLIETGMEVTGQLKSEDGFQWNWETFEYFTRSWTMVAHWLPALGLAIMLRLITHRFHHPLIFPAYFLMIPVIFYAITKGILGLPFEQLRQQQWVFDIGKAGDAPFWRFYTYFDFRQTSINALWATMPTQLALTFFSILHVPLNVPALAVSINEDNLDTDRELVAHGISNILAGFAGTTPNYLCYVNSVLFYRVGGGSTLSGLMLAAGTFVILLSGPGAIAYLPIVVVGALIFVLGLDLTKEAVWDTLGRVNRWEYFTIWVIIAVMTYYDFVVGILVGIILACLFFVIQTSRRRTVRAVLDGSIARSTVRRHTTQRHFLKAVGTQTQIVKLQGFLYFATIGQVEALIRRAIDIASWQHNPIRFLVVDFSLVNGVDFSAAEAFTRIQRVLEGKGVLLVFCGLTPESDVGIALRSVDMWADRGVRLEVFANLNEALEWTENEYLRGMYASGLAVGKQLKQASLGHASSGMDIPTSGSRKPAFAVSESFANSPRQHHLHQAARQATEVAILPPPGEAADSRAHVKHPQPLALLITTFQAYMNDSVMQVDEDAFVKLASYFSSMHLSKGEVLWQRGDDADSMYLVESGLLKVRYEFEQDAYDLHEAVLPGTLAGELSFLCQQPRGTSAFADQDTVLWRLDSKALSRLQGEMPDVFSVVLRLLLRAATDEQEGLLSYLVSRIS